MSRDYRPNVTHTSEETHIRFYRESSPSGKSFTFSHHASYKNTLELASGGNGAIYKGHVSKEDIPKVGEHPILIKKMGYFTDSRPRSIFELPINMRLEREVFEKRHGCYGKCFLSYEFHESTKSVDVYLQMPKIPGISLSKIKDLELALLDQLLIAQESIVVMCDFHSDEELSPSLAHRDIKTANMICEFVSKHFFIVRLIDFGSCKKGSSKYVGSIAGSTLSYAPPYHYSDETRNLFEIDSFSLGVVILEILGVKDFYKFRYRKNEELKLENVSKLKQYIRENEPDESSNRYEQFIKNLKDFKNFLDANRLKMITETEINYEGLLSDGLMNPDLVPYLNPVKEYLIELTDVGSKRKMNFDQVQLALGEAIGAVIAYHLLQNVKAIEDETYLDFSKNQLACGYLLDALYSKPSHEYIEKYSGRVLGANKFLKNYQEEYSQFFTSEFNYFKEEAVRSELDSLFEKSVAAKLEEGIGSLLNNTSMLEEQRLIFLDIYKGDQEHLIPVFIGRINESIGNQTNWEIKTTLDLMKFLVKKFINNLNVKFRQLFDLTAEDYNENMDTFFELMTNKTIELYRVNTINELELGEILTLFIVKESPHHEENISDILINTINSLNLSCANRFLKLALKELQTEIEQMSSKAYRYLYKKVNKILSENRLGCEIFSRFSRLLLALGENPSNQIIRIACAEFQKQCLALRIKVSNSEVTLLVSRRHRRVEPEALAVATDPETVAPAPREPRSRKSCPCCCVVS